MGGSEKRKSITRIKVRLQAIGDGFLLSLGDGFLGSLVERDLDYVKIGIYMISAEVDGTPLFKRLFVQ
jgi:hypothetical protein